MEKDIIRMFSDTEGETHFEDSKIQLTDVDGFFRWTEHIKATGFYIAELFSSEFNDWHVVPRRQYLVPLEGKAEFGVSDGSKRVIGPGTVLLAEDTTGKGHTRQLLNNAKQTVLLITLD